tara:strand:+ start:1057 stop:1245 length:189 start_codon:yes stop_codon:yes gene_type:complete
MKLLQHSAKIIKENEGFFVNKVVATISLSAYQRKNLRDLNLLGKVRGRLVTYLAKDSDAGEY